MFLKSDIFTKLHGLAAFTVRGIFYISHADKASCSLKIKEDEKQKLKNENMYYFTIQATVTIVRLIVCLKQIQLSYI